MENVRVNQKRIDKCLSEAKRYKTRVSFFKESHNDYCYLQKLGLLKSACEHMELSPVYSYIKWSKEAATSDAKKYNSRSEFKLKNSGAYCYAKDNGFIDDACSHMSGGSIQWTRDLVLLEAGKYKTRSEFSKNSNPAYKYACRNNILDAVCSHMQQKRKWTKESVMAEAQKYQSISDFFSAFPGAYKHANKYDYWSDACAHMDVKKRPMDKEMAMTEAKKYITRTDFQASDGGAYVYARLNGFLDEACAHMDVRKRNLDREFVLVEAKKFKYRSHFKLMETGCYMYAKRNGFLEDACAHMVLLPSGFKDAGSATMYHLRISGPDGSVLYKIGITNRTPQDRIQSLYLHEGFSAEVLDEINFDSGREARIAEKRLHRRASSYRYAGPPIMKNGNTELFTEKMFDEAPIMENGNTEVFSRDATIYLQPNTP